jgi:hypothetical protein
VYVGPGPDEEDEDPVYDELEGADADEEPGYEEDPVYDELDGTEGGAEDGAAAAGAAEDPAGEAVVSLVGVNDGRRVRGVKTDSRSGLGSSALGVFFAGDLSSAAAGRAAAAFLGFPMRSAGSGGTPLLPLAAGPVPEAAEPAGAAEVPVSSARDGDPVRDGAPSDPECELPALVRDDDMMPLSTTESSVSTSGSVSRTGGAIMNGMRVVGPASSTPSSSVPTGPFRTFA